MKKTYSLRHDFLVKSYNLQFVGYGTETASFLALRLWRIIPEYCKNATSLTVLKEKIKKVGFLKTVHVEHAKFIFKTFVFYEKSKKL